MKVEVILKKWGSYKQGDQIDLPDTTAKACIKSGAVKEIDSESTESKTSNKKKK